MRPPVRLAPLAVILALAVAAPALAGPKAGPHATRGAAGPKPLDAKARKALQDKLAGGPASIVAALAAAQSVGRAASALAPDIEEILRRGSSAAIVEGALSALGALGSPSSALSVAPYVRHRVPALRRAAARALAALPSATAERALRDALRSGDGEVRGLGAIGLGAIGAASALPDLFLALDRDVPEAAVAIGRLCGPDDCRRFTARLGKVGFDVMTSGIESMLFRERPLPEDELLGVVIALRDLGTPEARRYLGDVATRWPAAGSKRVKQALDDAVRAIPASLGGER